MPSELELAAMRRAITLSGFGLGTTSPNPPVGCVVLSPDGEIIGEGFHECKGEPHAEGNALAMAGDHARGGTAVVTLEPCNHEGRAPACRRLLVDAGITRCVIALLDPTSREEGGAQRLRDNDIDVEVDVLADEAKLVLGPWLHAQTTQRPHVTWTYTIDDAGAIVPVSGDWEHQQRATADAVMSQDGTITNGSFDSPGSGVPDLERVNTVSPPRELLRHTYTAGVRRLLLNVNQDSAAPYAAAGAIDSVEAYIRPGCLDTLPTELRLADVRKIASQTLRVTGIFQQW